MLACILFSMMGCGAKTSAPRDESPNEISSPDTEVGSAAAMQSPFADEETGGEVSSPSIAKMSRAPQEIGIPPAMGSRQDPMPSASPFESLPTGADYSAELGYATVRVFYATDRAQDSLPLSAYQVTGSGTAFFALMITATICGLFAAFSLLKGRSMMGAVASAGALASAGIIVVMLSSGAANIEKDGVHYNTERGILTRGLAEVTVPDTHQRGMVERPSLLRFEFREDQSKHIVLTSAKELGELDFYRRLTDTVDTSPEQDLLVFIHGYNVDFESAIQRTAQLAVDLPFRGVPVCYSWPSQGQILGYTIDENNASWTISHLKTFLYELAEKSGAKSINVIAHSMGTRALTGALSEISFEIPKEQSMLFDRVILAAPDIDADQFRRDIAPRVLRTASSVTLYASSDDNALIASKQVHGYPRAGESGSQLVVVAGVETIDVSGIDLSLLGHSYYGDSQVILGDLFQLVHDGLPASQRQTLQPRDWSGLQYWQLNTDWMAGLQPPPSR